MRNLEKIKKLTGHPLEDVLGIEPNSTEVVRYERNTELADYEPFDEKEKELESHYQEIADLAISSYKKLDEIAESADTKLLARLTEVQFQGLTTALAALEKRARLKEAKDKAMAKDKAASTKGNVTNNIIAFGNRNDILKQVIDVVDLDPSVIEAEFKELE